MNARLFLSSLALLITLASPVLAADLQSARAAGQLGEKNDGYVTVLDGQSDTQALADSINAKRKDEYANIAAKKGQSITAVGSVFAETIVQNLPKGAKYQDKNGAWKTK